MRGAYETPDVPCPYCGKDCSAEFVDIGIGMQQVGPYRCFDCNATEACAYDSDEALKSVDLSTGWYPPEK